MAVAVQERAQQGRVRAEGFAIFAGVNAARHIQHVDPVLLRAPDVGQRATEPQFVFLDEALDRHPELQKIILMHHAPTIGDDAGYEWERLGSEDTRRLLAALKGRNVAGVLTGHIHYDRVSFWHGIPVIVGNGHHNFVDPTYRKGLRIRSGASFALCTLRPSGLTVSFVPLPSDRREFRIVPDERARSYV